MFTPDDLPSIAPLSMPRLRVSMTRLRVIMSRLLVVESGDAGKHLALEELQRRATSSRHEGNLHKNRICQWEWPGTCTIWLVLHGHGLSGHDQNKGPRDPSTQPAITYDKNLQYVYSHTYT